MESASVYNSYVDGSEQMVMKCEPSDYYFSSNVCNEFSVELTSIDSKPGIDQSNTEFEFVSVGIKQEPSNDKIKVEHQTDDDTSERPNSPEVRFIQNSNMLTECIKDEVETELNSISEEIFHCDSCSFVCTSNLTLSIHLKSHTEPTETESGKYECRECGKKFKYKSGVKNHMVKHTGDKPFPCRYCSTKFEARTQLESHEMTHTGEKPFECTFCAKKFIRKTQLMNHERIHTDSRPFECNFCRQKFTLRGVLISHIKIHTGEKKFDCSFCSKGFLKKSDLTNHERVHTGEKPFECDVCGLKFSQKVNLGQHKRKYHLCHSQQ